MVEVEIRYPQPSRISVPCYNLPPTKSAVIIYQEALKNDTNTNPAMKYVIESSTFGLVPVWAKPTDPESVSRKDGQVEAYSKELQRYESRQFNCRKESLGSDNALPTWNIAKNRSRCVVPIKGYFEWQKTSNDKIPYFVYSSTCPVIYLAGLYSHNKNYRLDSRDQYFSSFAIVTGPATKEDTTDLVWLHPRKPMMLSPGTKQWFDWLDPNKDWDDCMLETVLNTKDNDAYKSIQTHTVSRAVGKPENQGKELIEKVQIIPQKSITSFFHNNHSKRVKKEDQEPIKRVKVIKKEKPDIFATLKKLNTKNEK